ncbi:hypothetical protein PYW07_004716 [Mythimna separata]|uniref:Uncharacterized protein n=1 Tax=Mythimna separata TaxID=271217 RepID=A0AAD7YYZ6_MYTSE|nr:hypothetical protein PYW07_004716 [Mythimna separata]
MSMPKTSELYEDPLRKSLGHSSLYIRGNRVRHGRVAVSLQDQSHIEWSNLIFLQFHPVFRMIMVAVAILKVMMGPIQSVYPIVYCNDVMDYHPVLIFIKYFYFFCCDALYAIDTFLHMAHRQVVDKAMRREHLPKSAIWLICDLLSLIPFFRLIVTDPCGPAQIWPNILLFNEFLVLTGLMKDMQPTCLDQFLCCRLH